VVLADGRLVECDEEHDRELFWALRGAGSGNFGVVTSFAFRTRPAASATNFHLSWQFARAAALIDAWQAWAPTAPDELYASLLVTAGPELEDPPAVDVFGSMLGSDRDTAELLDELAVRVRADPTAHFRKHMSSRETARYWAVRGPADPADPDGHLQPAQHEYPVLKSEFFRRLLPGEAVAALLEVLVQERVAGQARELDFTPWGG